MTFDYYKNEIVEWFYPDQERFLENVSFNVSVGIRSIISDPDLSSENKLESIGWFNEFIHNVNEQKFLSKHSDKSSFGLRILTVFENANFYSLKDSNTKFMILEIIKLSFNSAKSHGKFNQ